MNQEILESAPQTDEKKPTPIYSYDEALAASLEYFKGDELPAKTFVDKYAMRDLDNNIYELTPDAMHRRMAKEFGRIEDRFEVNLNGKSKTLSKYGQERERLSEERIYELFKDFKYAAPQGSVMAILGNQFVIGSLSNCIVLPEVFDSYGGIMFSDQQLVQLQKRRCVSADTKIYIETKGLLPISEVSIGDKILSYDLKNQKQVFRKVLNKWETFVSEENRISFRTKNGTVLRSSKIHPILVDKGDYYWLENPNIGDDLVSPIGKIIADSNISKSEAMAAWFSGMHCADGSSDFKLAADGTYSTRLRMLSDNKSVISQYVNCIRELGGSNTQLRENKDTRYKTKCWVTESRSKGNATLVEKYLDNQYGGKAYSVRIPKFITGSLFWPFLAGVIDGDGHIDKDGRISVGMCSSEFIDALAIILELNDIRYNVRIRKDKRGYADSYKITIANTVWDKILPYLYHDLKRKILSNKKEVREYSSSYWLSPNEQNNISDNYQWSDHRDLNLDACERHFRKSHKAGIGMLNVFEEHNLITTDFKDRVRSRQEIIEKTDDLISQKYFDIEVEGTNNFYAGNYGLVVVHNC